MAVMLDCTNAKPVHLQGGHAEGNQFIICTPHKKPSDGARKLIRSHVMRGKNRRKAASPVDPETWINHASELETTQDSDMLSSPKRALSGSALATVQYAEPMQPYMYDLIWTSFNIIMKAVYPVELCLHFNPKATVWFEYLQTDTVYFHSQMWLSQSYIDWTHGDEPSQKALLHQNITINLLRQRLLDPDLAILDTTISVVVTLVNMSAMSGNAEEARRHMKGLCKMVSMRGGVRALRQNTQLQLKVCRADLSTALLSGEEPLFFSRNISWKPFLPPLSASQTSQLAILPTRDHKLSNVYSDLRTFSITTNIAFQSTHKLSPTLFQETLISTQYRLSFLDYPYNSIEHIIRLALLIFSTSVFLQTRGIRTRFHVLSSQLYTAISGNAFKRLESQLRVWILVMAAIVAVTDEDDFWILPLLRDELEDHEEVKTWDDLRKLLKSFLWIDVLHDLDGKVVMGKVFASSGNADAV